MRNADRAVTTSAAGIIWRKSTASNPSGNCVELAELPGGDIVMRNSRLPTGPRLIYTRPEIAAFFRGVQLGEFDDLTDSSGPPLGEPVVGDPDA